MVCWPIPPDVLSMLMILKAPTEGLPVSSWIVVRKRGPVLTALPPLQVSRYRWPHHTPKGATYWAWPTLKARATADALTSTESMPSTRERNPGAVRFAFTVIVSSVNVFEEKEMSAGETLP